MNPAVEAYKRALVAFQVRDRYSMQELVDQWCDLLGVERRPVDSFDDAWVEVWDAARAQKELQRMAQHERRIITRIKPRRLGGVAVMIELEGELYGIDGRRRLNKLMRGEIESQEVVVLCYR